MDTLVFTVCTGVIFTFTNKNTPVYVLIASAMAGQILYDAHSNNFIGPPPPKFQASLFASPSAQSFLPPPLAP